MKRASFLDLSALFTTSSTASSAVPPAAAAAAPDPNRRLASAPTTSGGGHAQPPSAALHQPPSPTMRRRAVSHSDLTTSTSPSSAAAPKRIFDLPSSDGTRSFDLSSSSSSASAAARRSARTSPHNQQQHQRKQRRTKRSTSLNSSAPQQHNSHSHHHRRAAAAGLLAECATSVYVWGRSDGQLGDGSVSGMSAVPCCVEDLKGKHVTSLSCGAKHSMALTESGDVYTWGWNFNGQLGYDYKDEFRPRLLKPLLLIKALQQKRVASVATGAVSSAALMQSGEVYTWGGNTDHQLGHGDDKNQATLRLVLRLHNYRVTKLSCGGGHVLALTSSGSLFSWGRNINGRLGHGHSQPVSVPEKVKALQGAFITKIACGWSHSLCYSDRDGGRLWTWGVGKDGRLGQGDNSDRSTPTEVQALRGVLLSHISGGYYHSAAVTDEGQVWTWGWGEHGQLGHGTLDTELTPRRVNALANVGMVALECGGFHSMGYDDQGRCWVFGLGEHGQLGILEERTQAETESSQAGQSNGTTEPTPPEKRSVPTVVESLSGKRVVFVAAGLWHSMAIVVAGEPCTHPPASFTNFVSEVQKLDSQLLPQASARMKSASFGCLPYQGEEEASGGALFHGRGAQLHVSGEDDEDTDSEGDYYDELGEEDEDEDEAEEEYGEEEPTLAASHTQLRAEVSLVMSPSPDQGLIGKLATWIMPVNSHSDHAVKEKKLEQQAQYWERHILRHWAKMHAIPNFLAVTPGQYASLREAGQIARTKRLEATKKAGMEEQPGLIELDLPRTFPKLSLFNEEGPFYRQLWDILETYSIFRPEIGYVQGMSFLAAMFLLYMDEFTSFRCLANMLEFPFFRALYKMDIAHILRFVRVYELLFSQQLPELYNEFTQKNISPEHYLLDWFFTLFSRALPFDIVGRLWDRYFLEGEVFLFRAALAILKISSPRLKGNSFEEICLLLRQLPQDMDEAKLFEAIHTITVPEYCKRFIQRLRAEDERGLEIQMESVDHAELTGHEDDDDEEPDVAEASRDPAHDSSSPPNPQQQQHPQDTTREEGQTGRTQGEA